MRLRALFVCLATLLLPMQGLAASDIASITKSMQQRYDSMQRFSATFTQTLTHQESGSEEVRSGSLLFAKPLRIRWETQEPHPELLVVTEEAVWDYLPDEELAYRYSPEVVKDSRSVIQVITGQAPLNKDFTLAKEPSEEGLTVIRLYPKEPTPQLVEAVLWLDAEFLIRRARIMDFYGNTNDIQFTSLKPNATLEDKAFHFSPPQGVTVEDLMHQSAPERPLLQ